MLTRLMTSPRPQSSHSPGGSTRDARADDAAAAGGPRLHAGVHRPERGPANRAGDRSPLPRDAACGVRPSAGIGAQGLPAPPGDVGPNLASPDAGRPDRSAEGPG